MAVYVWVGGVGGDVAVEADRHGPEDIASARVLLLNPVNLLGTPEEDRRHDDAVAG